MKLTKILPIIALSIVMAGCNKPAGELVGAYKSTNFKEANPYGMLFIKKGSSTVTITTLSGCSKTADCVLAPIMNEPFLINNIP